MIDEKFSSADFPAKKDGELLLQQTLMQAPVGMTILRGPQFIVELANEKYLELVGREEKHFIGRPLFVALPEVREMVEPLLNSVLETGKPFFGNEFMVYLVRHGKKEKAWFNFIYQALKDQQGNISGVIVIANEVTEQFRAKHMLAESEREFRNLIMQSPIAMTVWRGEEHVVEMANTVMFSTIWRKEEQDVIGRKALDVFPELRDQKYPDLLKKVLESGIPHRESESVAYIQGDDGMRKFYLDFEYAPLREADGSISGIMITVNDVTTKVEARHKLEDAEARLRLAVDGTGLATWDLNLLTRDIIHSPRLAEIFGYAPHVQLLHPVMRQHIHPEDLSIVEDAFARAMDTGVYFYEARVVWPDFSEHWIRTRGKVIFDTSGKPQRMLGTIVDWSQEKTASRIMQDNEQRLNIAIDAAELGTWEVNAKTKERIFSPRYLHLLGFAHNYVPSEDEILNRIHPDDLNLRKRAIAEAMHTGILDVEMQVLLPDSTIRWVRAKGRMLFDERGQLDRMMGTLMDITEQKTAFNVLQEFNQRLQASELLFKTISNVSPVGLWMTNAEGQNTFVNDTWARWTGIQTDGISNNWVNSLLESDKETTITQFRAKAAKKEKFSAEFRFSVADGSLRWGLSEGFPYYDTDGNYAGYAGSVTDITERKQDELLKNDFLAVASHELKTPITSIKAYTQLLAKTYDKSDDALLKNALSKIENQVNKMSKLVGDFLNLSKIESDKFKLYTERVVINDLLREVVADMQMVAPTHLIQIIQDGIYEIRADREKIMQVVTNFLTNAVKYSPGEKLIEVSVQKSENIITVSVKDFGIGIRGDEHQKIFQRFYRADSNNIQVSGFGIGLYISAEIIREHGGQIGVQSSKSRGSEFYFKLPVAD